MRHPESCRLLSAEASRFVAALATADLTAPVPTCPGWDLAELAGHVGATHRWVTTMVTERVTKRLGFRPFRDAVPADPAALPGWVAEGAGELVRTLEAVPPERPMWAWGADQHAGFWSRRMLHELVIHQADAAFALGAAPAVEVGVAADGVEEFLVNLPHASWIGGAAAIEGGAGRQLALVASDVGATWLVTLGAETLTWARTATSAGADVTVRGPVTDLYLFLWGRIPAPEVAGDAELLASWSRATAL